jgi:hypothetical protein
MASSVAIAAETGMKERPPTKTIRPKPKPKVSKMKSDDESASSSAVVVGVVGAAPASPEITGAPDVVIAAVEQKEPVYCDTDLFVKDKIRRTISIPFYKLGKGVVIAQLLRTELAKIVEGRCSIEGYICPDSVAISSYSCGTLAGSSIHFDIIADCLICFPDENTVIKCVAKTITQAGVRAGAKDLERGKVSPIEVFLSRDMHACSRELFSRIEENDILTVKIIGRRFVLHDTHITIIAMLLDMKKEYKV